MYRDFVKRDSFAIIQFGEKLYLQIHHVTSEQSSCREHKTVFVLGHSLHHSGNTKSTNSTSRSTHSPMALANGFHNLQACEISTISQSLVGITQDVFYWVQ